MRGKPFLKPALAAFSGILFFLSFPAFNLYLLGWIAFMPLLFALERTSLRQAYLLGLVTGMVAVGGGFYWMADWAVVVMAIPFPLNQLAVLAHAFCIGHVFGLSAFFFRWFRRPGIVHDIVLFPLALTVVFSLFPMLFAFRIGDGQSYFLPAVQAVELTGVYGLDFVVALVNILVYKLIQIPREKIARPVLAACLILLVGWFGYGVYSLSQWDVEIGSWEKKRIGIVQPNRPAILTRPQPEKGYSRSFPLDMEMSRRLAEMGAEMVFWPEGHFYGYAFWSEVRQAFQIQIKSMNIPFVIYDSTYKMEDGEKHYFNTSLFIDEDGALVDQYHKMKLVPFGEYTPLVDSLPFAKSLLGDFLTDLRPGMEHKTFSAAGMRIVPKICYEPLFPRFVAESVGGDSRGKVLLVQTQDGWYGETAQPEQHMAIAALRAVENRVPLVHVINNGSSAVVLPNGRYVFRSPAFTRGYWIAEMPYNPGSGGSFFSRHPSLFINMVRGLFAICLLLSLPSLPFFNKPS
ncbi:MAG: apolipoprotein N-acyltransferase [Proteobacteria bacterium]|nr:apolipoprotein N-acyltransferase [Pseudomonadota bacterium]